MTFVVCDFSRLAFTDWRLWRWRLCFLALMTATRIEGGGWFGTYFFPDFNDAFRVFPFGLLSDDNTSEKCPFISSFSRRMGYVTYGRSLRSLSSWNEARAGP